MELEIDRSFVSRLLLGALSEHEQRMLAVRLARHDDGFRASLAEVLEPFETFDSDLVAEYSAALDQASPALDSERREILARASARAVDLERLIQGFTVADALSLGGVTRQFFSWSMAEHLLERSRKSTDDKYRARTHAYLALMVIDVVEILAATGRSPFFANVVADVRRRIRQPAEA